MKNYAGRTAGRAAGQVTAGRGGAGCGPSFCGAGGLRAIFVATFAVRADCGPSYCGAGRAAGYDVANFAVRADCGPSYCGAGRAAGSDFQPAQGLNVQAWCESYKTYLQSSGVARI